MKEFLKFIGWLALITFLLWSVAVALGHMVNCSQTVKPDAAREASKQQ